MPDVSYLWPSYANGPQTIALFGLGLKRFPALLGALTFMSAYVSFFFPRSDRGAVGSVPRARKPHSALC